MAKRKPQTKGNNLKAARQVYRHIPTIEMLHKTKNPRLRCQILDLSPATIKAISSITDNALKGTLPLSKAAHRLLEKSHTQAQNVTKGSLASRKKAIQHGGFIPLLAKLIPAATAFLGGILGD